MTCYEGIYTCLACTEIDYNAALCERLSTTQPVYMCG